MLHIFDEKSKEKCQSLSHIICFSGGNQRDLARAKNQKKLTDLKKGARTDNLTVEQRKARYVRNIDVLNE